MSALAITAVVLVSTTFGHNYSIEYLRSLSPAEAAQLTIEQFTYAYNAYKQYAWGCDERMLYVIIYILQLNMYVYIKNNTSKVAPVSRVCHNQYQYSLMWTPIDSLGI